MHFETRYLVRWGVPGWIFIISIGIYYIISEYEVGKINELIDKAPGLLATAALLIIIGIPVGYLLNQIHHVWIWVVRVNWNKYFSMEMELSKIFHKADNGKELTDRYRYLLTRVHELGSIVVAFIITNIIIIIRTINESGFDKVDITCFFIYLFLLIVIALSRNYYERNLDAFTYELIGKNYYSVKSWFWFVTSFFKRHGLRIIFPIISAPLGIGIAIGIYHLYLK